MDNRAAFDRIAEIWYRIYHRTRFQDDLRELAGRWRSGRLLNIGCGHGPDFEPFKSGFELHGVDFSPGMLAMARRFAGENGLLVNLIQADARQLPYVDGAFDRAIAVATYHHVEGARARRQAFEELRRVLKPDGEAFLTVWNRNQPRFEPSGGDTLVPFRVGKETVQRYYHLYTFDEFGKALEEAGFVILRLGPEASFRGQTKEVSRNICALLKK
ncbi:MAG: class I SAM-dependent methyltransferase [Chloroflexota bacterium]